MTDRDLIEGSLPPVSSSPVAHYTRHGTLPLLFSSSSGWDSAWATPVQFLNDRRELTLGLQVLQKVANQAPKSSRLVRSLIDSLLTTHGRPETDAFQMSFSRDTDDLGQWRGYAANSMGCAVVTDALAVRSAGDVAGWVLYDRKAQRVFAGKVLEGLRRRQDTLDMEQALVAAACFMKDEGFRSEQEFRLVCFARPDEVQHRAVGDRLGPYIDYLKRGTALPVSTVIVGPGWQLRQLEPPDLARNHVMLGIRRLLGDRGLHTVPVVPSAIPFDPR